MVHSGSMDSPTIVLIAVLLLFVLLDRLKRAPAPAPVVVAPAPAVPADHTSELIGLVRETVAAMERVAMPPAVQLPDYAEPRQPAAFDMDLLDPTDGNPWLDRNAPQESTVNVAPEPATHPMGIPGLETPWFMQAHDAKLEQPFDRFRTTGVHEMQFKAGDTTEDQWRNAVR